MSKPIPKQPIKVSKKKKTLPVEIDWGQGMKDRLRYISPGEEAMIQRNRSTDAERYYGGIRAYPDPGDTAAGDYGRGTSSSGGITTGTTTGTTTTTTGSSYGTGSNTDVGGREGGAGSGMGGDSGTNTSSGAGASAAASSGATTPAVSGSRAADPGYTGGISGGSAENAFRNAEGAYRGGINSLDGSIGSGNIVTVSDPTYAQSQYSYASSVPAPVAPSSTAESIYGPGYVTDDMLPDYGASYTPPQNITAAQSLKGMLAQGSGVYVGPPAGPTPPSVETTTNVWSRNDFSGATGPRVNAYGRGVSLSDTTDRTSGTPSTVAADTTIDRLAANRGYIGNSQPGGGVTQKSITDRVPGETGISGEGGIASIETPSDIDAKRAISTIASAEGVPETVVASTVSAPSLPKVPLAQGPDWINAYKTNTAVYTPGPPPKVDREDSVNQAKPYGVRGDIPDNIVVDDGSYAVSPPPAAAPEDIRLFAGEDPLPPGYMSPGVVGTKLVRKDGTAPTRTRGVSDLGTPSEGGIAGLGDEQDLSPLDIPDETGGAATDETVDEYVSPSQEGIDGLPMDPSIPGQNDLVRGRPLTPEQIAARDADIRRAKNTTGVFTRALGAGTGTGSAPRIVGDQLFKKYEENVKEKIDAYTNATPAQKAQMEKTNPELMGWSERLGIRPSGVYGAEHYDNWAQAAGMRMQGDREGGQDYAANLANNWRNGIGIPNPGDPDYAAYMYWLNSSGWGWS